MREWTVLQREQFLRDWGGFLWECQLVPAEVGELLCMMGKLALWVLAGGLGAYLAGWSGGEKKSFFLGGEI